ncbi:MAG: phosphopantothenoylcysteine decarboxylase [Phycisphaeraceae bacterium]|nr:phosphopantothenoylcysteine decarboxylase [Phycisphaeraceae bacterium]
MPLSRILITSGPTHEPIDAVRFIGNRSSGRMGAALADAAAARGNEVVLLLGPGAAFPVNPAVTVIRFRTCADLQSLLQTHAPHADTLIMAAAVADYRPKPNPLMSGGKFRRTNQVLNLELEPTPDLLAEVARTRRAQQLFVGFALEPREEMVEAAWRKLKRKGIDIVVANPLGTMDSESVEATVVTSTGEHFEAPGPMSKGSFAEWFFELLAAGSIGNRSERSWEIDAAASATVNS